MELTRYNIENWKALVYKNFKGGHISAVFDNLVGMFGEKQINNIILIGDYSFFNDWNRINNYINSEIFGGVKND